MSEPDGPRMTEKQDSSKNLGLAKLHRELVEEPDPDEKSGIFSKIRKIPAALHKHRTRLAKPPPAAGVEEANGEVGEQRKAEEVRDLIKQQKMEAERLWDPEAEEEYNRQNPIFVGENVVDDAADTGPRMQPTTGFVSMYGVHIDNWWVGTSRAMLAVSYLLIVSVSCIVMWQLIKHETEQHVMAWGIGAVFVGLAIPISLQDIHMHIIHYVSPLQRHYVRILWMVPIYSVESWLALRFNEQKLLLETIREAYEAFVVYSFFNLMLEFLGPTEVALAKLAKHTSVRGKQHATMIIPCCCLRPWRLDSEFMDRCSIGVWQYVFIRTSSAIAVIVFEQYDMYGEGHLDWGKFYVYNVLVVNMSQCWALYCLILFYLELKDELAPIRPLGKFIVVKAVVFFSWWQQMVVTFLAAYEMIDPVLDYSSEDVAKAIQNLLIVVEMFIYAVAHRFVFTYIDFKAGGPLAKYLEETKAQKEDTKKAIAEMLPTDVLMEGKQYVDAVTKNIQNKFSFDSQEADSSKKSGRRSPSGGQDDDDNFA